MNLLIFFFYLLVSTMVVKKLVFPIVAGIQIWPAQKLEAGYPRLAAAWLGACAPIVWMVNLAWLVFTVWLTRTRGLHSSVWLTPLFVFLGWSGGLYPYTVDGKLGRSDRPGLEMLLVGIWIAFMAASFFVIKAAK